MSERALRSRRGGLAALLLFAGLGGGAALAAAKPEPAGTAEPAAADRELLAATDLFASAPASFRSRLRVTAGLAPKPGEKKTARPARQLELEVWRAGEERALVRFLDPRERGKYLLRRDGELYLIAPGAKRPVRLDPSHRLAGVSLDEILGLRLASDYRLVAVARANGVVTFDLVASRPGAAYPQVRWVVDERRKLPLRADLKLADGRTARVLELADWFSTAQLAPRRLVIKDILRGGPPITVELLELEARDVPAALFDLADGSARAALPAAPAAPTTGSSRGS